MASASETDKGLVAGLISLGVLLVGATTVFAELQSALDRIWHVPEAEKPQGIWAILRARLLSFGLILGLVFLLMVSLAVSTGIAALDTWVSGLFPGWEATLQVVNIVVSVGFTTLLFAMIFKLMPTARIAWRDVWTGAFVTAILFEVGKLLISLYLGKSGVTESFAAAGSLVVLLAWVYYAAQIFLLGAEFTKVYADEHGSLSAAESRDRHGGDGGCGHTARGAPCPARHGSPRDAAGCRTGIDGGRGQGAAAGGEGGADFGGDRAGGGVGRGRPVVEPQKGPAEKTALGNAHALSQARVFASGNTVV